MSKFYEISTGNYIDTCPYTGGADRVREQVSKIIEDRKNHQQILADRRKYLSNLVKAINKFSSICETTFGNPEAVRQFLGTTEAIAAVYWDKLQQVSEVGLKDLTEKCKAVEKKLENMEKRFKRKYVSIAVVGESRQGKSTLIQKITGLDDASVPTSSGGICTAARSHIINAPEQKAVIHFYTEEDFFHNIIAPYFVYFKVITEGERNKINSFIDAAEYYDKLMERRPDPDVYLKRLEDYLDVNKRLNYEDYLGSSPLEIEDFEELKPFMAQRDTKDSTTYDCRYLAVKDIEIETPFEKASDAGSLMIFDTIGVSEPTLGVKQQMLETISDEADIVLYVYKLSSSSEKWIYASQIKLYYDMIKQLKGVPAHRWIFWVFNHTDPEDYQGNGGLQHVFERNFNEVIDNIEVLGKGKDTKIYKPAGAILVNCTDSDSVGEKLVSPLISHLSGNLGAIDEALIETINNDIRELEAKLKKISPLFRDLTLPEKSDYSMKNTLKEKAKAQTLNAFRRKLPDALDRICPESEIPEWRQKVQNVIQTLNDCIPSERRIEKIYEEQQCSSLRTIEAAYQETVINLKNAFNRVEFNNDQMIQDVKFMICRLFIESANLKNLVPDPDPEDPEIITNFCNSMFGFQSAEYDGLREAFMRLNSFNVVQNEMLENWVVSKVSVLDTNRGNGNIPQFWDQIGLAVAIITKLQALVGEIRGKLFSDVENLDTPIQQIREKVESFNSEISTINSNFIVSWQNLFENYVEKMFPEEFKGVNGYNEKIKYWNDSIAQLMAQKSLEMINFQ